ncbi:MAG: S49 family peptidase [Thiotrichales bacterium]|nr:S49 family peptidase [Thiotrichales bacterium]
MTENSSNPEDRLALEVARETVSELRKTRRWRNFFYSLFALYLFGFFVIYFMNNLQDMGLSGEQHTALVDVNGIIAGDFEASADNIVSGLRAAYDDENTAGIIIRINSPGGSPVQAGYVNDEIKRLRTENPDIPVYAVISDMCASGGYYIAAAADRIFANKASIVGSIGVIMAGFGFVDAIDKLGVERRLLTAGNNKGFLDPFSPLKHDEVQHISTLLEDVHTQFIDVVREGRGGKITATDDEVFSGLVWTGEQSLEIGLVDELASSGQVARDIIGAEEIVDFTHREHVFDRFARKLGSAMMEALYTQFLLQLR